MVTTVAAAALLLLYAVIGYCGVRIVSRHAPHVARVVAPCAAVGALPFVATADGSYSAAAGAWLRAAGAWMAGKPSGGTVGHVFMGGVLGDRRRRRRYAHGRHHAARRTCRRRREAPSMKDAARSRRPHRHRLP